MWTDLKKRSVTWNKNFSSWITQITTLLKVGAKFQLLIFYNKTIFCWQNYFATLHVSNFLSASVSQKKIKIGTTPPQHGQSQRVVTPFSGMSSHEPAVSKENKAWKINNYLFSYTSMLEVTKPFVMLWWISSLKTRRSLHHFPKYTHRINFYLQCKFY